MAATLNPHRASQDAQSPLNHAQAALHSPVERARSGAHNDAPPADKNNRPAQPSSAGVQLQISPQLIAQTRKADSSAHDANDAIALTQTAGAALDNAASVLQRARGLAEQSERGTLSDEEQKNVQTELAALSNAINHMAQTTAHNGQKLLDGAFQGRQATVNGNRVAVGALPHIADLTGTRNATLQSTAAIDQALEAVSAVRMGVSGSQQQIGAATQSPASASTDAWNLKLLAPPAPASSNARRDTGSTQDTADRTRSRLLEEAGAALRAQGNALPRQVLALLR